MEQLALNIQIFLKMDRPDLALKQVRCRALPCPYLLSLGAWVQLLGTDVGVLV